MTAVSRNHHYVPQGYLAGFTDTGTSDGKLYVLDLSTGSTFRTRPRNVAAERDFNRVEIDGQDPDFLEKSLGALLEDKAALAIRKIAQAQKFTGDDDFTYVINLLCLLVVRNPRARRSLASAKRQSAKIIGEMLVSDKKIWEHHNRKAREAGYVSEPDVSFERVKAFVDGGKYTIEVATHALIRTELSIFDDILRCLGARVWSLLIAAPDAPDFITCDHPVTLVFKDPKSKAAIGVGLHQTELVFPITARHAFLGVYENPMKPVLSVKAKGVAAMNTRVIRHADRQIYSREPVISVLKNGEPTTFELRSNQ
jgi:hypothetical protein